MPRRLHKGAKTAAGGSGHQDPGGGFTWLGLGLGSRMFLRLTRFRV